MKKFPPMQVMKKDAYCVLFGILCKTLCRSADAGLLLLFQPTTSAHSFSTGSCLSLITYFADNSGTLVFEW